MIKKNQIILISIILGIMLLAYDYYLNIHGFDGTLKRLSPCQDTKSETVTAVFDGMKSDIDVEVSERALKEDEKKKVSSQQ